MTTECVEAQGRGAKYISGAGCNICHSAFDASNSISLNVHLSVQGYTFFFFFNFFPELTYRYASLSVYIPGSLLKLVFSQLLSNVVETLTDCENSFCCSCFPIHTTLIQVDCASKQAGNIRLVIWPDTSLTFVYSINKLKIATWLIFWFCSHVNRILFLQKYKAAKLARCR